MGLRTRIDSLGNWTSPSCKLIYELSNMANVKRIDVWMTELAVKFLGQCVHNNNENEIIDKCKIEDEEFDAIILSRGALTPMGLLKLSEKNTLVDNEGKLVYYHRRHETYDTLNVVYNTAQ